MGMIAHHPFGVFSEGASLKYTTFLIDEAKTTLVSMVRRGVIGRVSSPLRARGEACLSQHILHTAEIYGFFAHVVQAAKEEAEHALC
jgi:hypothetical protein